MKYGFSVYFLDSRNYEFKFYAAYSITKEEAKREFYLSALERGFARQRISRVEVATEFDWLNFEVHGDAWHSPNAKLRVYDSAESKRLQRMTA